MNIDFHYWITGMIARAAGFTDTEAKTIAYSSQFVDDNTLYLKVRDAGNGEEFANNISQTYDIMKPLRELMHIWPVFHFIPGNPQDSAGRRKDGLRHVMNTTPDSERARRFLDRSFSAPDETRLYRIGIASHGFVDTWAHQNFMGGASEFNNIPGKILLNIGHLDAGTQPDEISVHWDDARLLDSAVDNNQRFMEAARRLFEEYRQRLNLGGDSWSTLANTLETLMDQSNTDRQTNFRNQVSWLGNYDQHRWINDAMEDRPVPFAASMGMFQWKKPRAETDWYRFQLAVIEHKSICTDELKALYQETGVEALSVV